MKGDYILGTGNFSPLVVASPSSELSWQISIYFLSVFRWLSHVIKKLEKLHKGFSLEGPQWSKKVQFHELEYCLQTDKVSGFGCAKPQSTESGFNWKIGMENGQWRVWPLEIHLGGEIPGGRWWIWGFPIQMEGSLISGRSDEDGRYLFHKY